MRGHLVCISIVRGELSIVRCKKDVEILIDTDATYKGTIDAEVSFGDVLCWNGATIDRRRPLVPLWMGLWR